jgi:hypothetical protein
MKSAARVRGPSALPSVGQVKGSRALSRRANASRYFSLISRLFSLSMCPVGGSPGCDGHRRGILAEAFRRSRSSTPSIDASRSPPDHGDAFALPWAQNTRRRPGRTGKTRAGCGDRADVMGERALLAYRPLGRVIPRSFPASERQGTGPSLAAGSRCRRVRLAFRAGALSWRRSRALVHGTIAAAVSKGGRA